MAPAWQAIVPSLVPREILQPAIALNSMGINISRAIGPALAGFLITALGLAAPFVVNAASYLVIIAALIAWRPPPSPPRSLSPEPLLGAMATGIRHAIRSGPLKATLVRSFGFLTFASARSEEHTSELQSLMRISYAVFCLKKKKTITN